MVQRSQSASTRWSLDIRTDRRLESPASLKSTSHLDINFSAISAPKQRRGRANLVSMPAFHADTVNVLSLQAWSDIITLYDTSCIVIEFAFNLWSLLGPAAYRGNEAIVNRMSPEAKPS